MILDLELEYERVKGALIGKSSYNVVKNELSAQSMLNKVNVFVILVALINNIDH